MMKQRMKRFLSLLVAAALTLGMLPGMALAEGEGTYTQVTSVDEITAGGSLVLVAEVTTDKGTTYQALGTAIAGKIEPVEVTVSGNAVTATGDLPVWTAAASGNNITLSNGTDDLAYNSSTNFKADAGYGWIVSAQDNDTFRFVASGSTSRGIAYSKSASVLKFGAYAVSNAGSADYVFDLLVFKAGSGAAPTKVSNPKAAPASGSTVEQGSTVNLSCNTEGATIYISTNYTDDSNDTNDTWTAGTTYTLPDAAWDGDHTVYVKATKDGLDDSAVVTLKYKYKAPAAEVTIAEVRAAASGEFVVSGTVILLDGKNVVIQDATGGINLYCSTAPSGLALGDTVKGTGVRGEYRGLLQLASATVEKTGSGTLPTPADITIADVGESYESQLVKIAGAKVTAIDGTTVTLSQGEGDDAKAINIHLCPTKENLTVGDTVTVTAVVSEYNAYQLRVSSADDIDITDDTTPDIPEPEFPLATGDKVAIYYPKGAQAMTGNDADGNSRLDGAGVTISGDTLVSATPDVALFDVTVDDATKQVKFGLDGKFLTTGASGGNLTLAADAGELSLWTLESTTDGAGGWFIHSVGAKYSGNANQYIEYYSGFTTYSRNTSSSSYDATIYVMQFFPAAKVILPEISVYDSDPEVVQSVAAWGGSAPGYDDLADKTVIPGDLYQSGDMKDAEAKFTVRANGAAAQAYQRTNGSGSTAEHPNYNYYMGAANVGKADGDYVQFEFPAVGYADMELSFRLRGTTASAGEYSVQYSADDGATFRSFGAGSYSYAYHDYGADQDISGTGDIVGGKLPVAKDSIYFSYTLSVPAGAENAAKVLVRLIPGTAKISGTGDVGGNIRIDSVVVSGHPIVSDSITGYVTVTPDNEEDQPAGTELTLTTATAGAAIQYRFVDPATGAVVADWATYDAAAKPKLPDTLPAVLEAKATAAGKAPSITRRWTYAAGTVATVKMEPNGGGVYIAEADGSASVTLSCATDGATIYYSDTGEAPEDYKEYTGPISLTKGFGSKTIRAYAVRTGFSNSALATRTFTERSNPDYQLYFGQIHSHTNYSDGAGSCDEAFQHAKGLDEAWNIDFLAVTDHSNSFDNADSASIANGSVSSEWVEGHELADAHTGDGFVGIYGYEMTWSNGLGHMNTFNTPGFQSRTQSEYSTYGTALQNYYATLKTQPGSINQFNHPGTTFGDFSDFAHYDEELDAIITIVEVGNGEGAIGSSGYFPSYEYYTRALDKGWHVAPTNNQDNHKGHWGDANTGRTVVLADGLNRESIYDALRNYRTYATEDLNLEILYTLDGSTMGTILDGPAGDTAQIKVELKDPDDAGAAKVQVIVNGGLVAAEKTATCNETVTFDVPTTYAYYYIKVTQADGDIAVTAPVWLGKVEAVGVGSMTAQNAITVAGQEQTIDLSLYNNENKPLIVDSIVFTDKATGKVLHTDATITSVPKLGTAECSFTYTFPTDGQVTVLATVKGQLKGVEKTYTQELRLTVMPAEMVRTVIVDGTHYNDYVTGYYGGNMGNMTTIAAGVGVQVKVVQPGETITAEMLENCALLVVSAPARKNGTANAGAYTASVFEDSFIDTVAAYVAAGGKVAVCGLADYQDKNAVYGDEGHAAAQLNKLLAAIGSTMSINDDEVYDKVHNGGQAYRLYPEIFNAESRWTKGLITQADVAEGETYQTYSQYSGCSVNPGSGAWLVKGFDTTMGVDSDKDGVGNTDAEKVDNYDIVVPMGSVVFLAAEDVGEGTVFAAGGVFLSDFEVKAELDNIWDLPYANRTIYENILKSVREDVVATPIADIRKAELNRMFVAEGYVTSGTVNPNTTFFDSIYIQDATAGITIFPYAVSGLAIGTKVRVIGSTDEYQGDREIQITSLEILDDEPQIQKPKVLTTAEAADYETNGGWLVKTQGTVSDIIMEGGVIAQFKLTDSSGVAVTVFIDGYITNEAGENTVGSWIKAGDTVSAVGLSYLHPEGSSDVSVCVLRVRNCDEIELVEAGTDTGSDDDMVPTTAGNKNTEIIKNGDGSVTTITTDKKGNKTTTTVAPDGSKTEATVKADGGKTITVTDAKGEVQVKIELPATIPAPETKFTDVPEGHWAESAVNDMAGLELVKGVSEADHIFDLTSDITRGSLASILFRFSNGETGLENPFADVAAEAWYTDAVAWASKTGVVNGNGSGDFLPNNAISRQELAVMLFRYARLIGMDVKTEAGLTQFSDSADVAAWATEAMTWCVGKGVLNGASDPVQGVTLSPAKSASRAECAVMLGRFIALI